LDNTGIKVKPSYYNEIIQKEDGVVVYNTSTGAMIKSFGDTSKVVSDVLHISSSFLLDSNNEAVSALYKDGFLVDDCRDEFLEMEKMESDRIFDKYLNILILPTEQCNFRCVYCYEKFERGTMTLETQQNISRFVDEHIDEYEGLNVSWFGGEPLEALDVIVSLSQALINVCKAHKKLYFAGMTTNAYNLTLDVFKLLKRLHVLEYQITLDGFPDEHDRQRILPDGKGTASQITDNLLSIKNGISSNTFRITLRTNFTRPMLKNAGAFAEFLKQTFCDDNRFGIFWQVVEDYGYLPDDSIKENFCSVDEYITLIRKYAFNFKNNVFKTAFMPGGTICYAMKRNAFAFGADGAIKKCTCDLENEENHLGIVGVSFDEEKLDKWLDRDLSPSCHHCKKRPICHNRGCKKITHCPPNLVFYKDMIEHLAGDSKFYKVI
jgi:uncharacterized protein